MQTMHYNPTYRVGGEIEVNRLGYAAMRLTGQPGFSPHPGRAAASGAIGWLQINR